MSLASSSRCCRPLPTRSGARWRGSDRTWDSRTRRWSRCWRASGGRRSRSWWSRLTFRSTGSRPSRSGARSSRRCSSRWSRSGTTRAERRSRTWSGTWARSASGSWRTRRSRDTGRVAWWGGPVWSDSGRRCWLGCRGCGTWRWTLSAASWGSSPGTTRFQPISGDSLQLTIDLGLQEWIHGMLADTVRGAVVALDPRTGEVLAHYSAPTFDPNDLVGTVSRERWADSSRTRPGDSWTAPWPAPTRRARRGSSPRRPSRSTWASWSPPRPSHWRVGEGCGTATGTSSAGSAPVTAIWSWPTPSRTRATSISISWGSRSDSKRLLKEGVRLGFDGRTGVDLPGERAGLFPSGPGWYERRFGWTPTEAEVLSLAIGQGANDQTPLKMAQFFGALATDGRMPAPRVVRSPRRGAGEVRGPAREMDLRVSPENLEHLREGLRRVTAPGGTAAGSALEHWDWIGKTGTSQNPHGKDHGWFVGIGGPRGGAAEIVVAALIEGGEHGSECCAGGGEGSGLLLANTTRHADRHRTDAERALAEGRSPHPGRNGTERAHTGDLRGSAPVHGRAAAVAVRRGHDLLGRSSGRAERRLHGCMEAAAGVAR